MASENSQALSGIIAQEGVRPVWEQKGGEHSQIIPCPFAECQNPHTQPSPPPVCLAPAKRGQKGN